MAGRPAIQKFWQEDIQEYGQYSVTMKSVEVQGSGDNAHQVSGWGLTAQDGKVIAEGKAITIWKKEDGKWKMHRDIWNDDRALNSSETAGRKAKLSKELKQMEDSVGEWEVTSTDENGKTIKGRFVMEIDPSGRSVTGYWSDAFGMKGVGRNLWYFDPGSQRIVTFSIGPDGSVGTGYIPKAQGKGQEETMMFQGITGDRKLMNSLDHLKWIGKDTLEYWTTDFVLDGKKQPDSPKAILKRVK